MESIVKNNPLENMEVRPARLEDREAVLAIAQGLYDGRDYLPAKYNQYLQDPNRAAIIAWIGGKAVAFHQFYFVDNGKTAVVQTSRVSADYQGTGMWKVFRKYQLLLLEQFPNVTHVAYTSGQKKLHIQRWKDGKTGSKYIMSRMAFHILIDERIREFQWDKVCSLFPSIAQINLLTKEDFLTTLSDESNQASWFPSGRIILCWEPFRLEKDNLKIISEKPGIFSCVSTSPEDSSRKYLSISSSMKISIGERYDMDFFGSSIDHAVAHAFVHITNWLQTHADLADLVFTAYLPETMDLNQFQERFKAHFGGSYGQTYTLCLFESDVEKYEISDRLALIAEGKLKPKLTEY